HDLDVAGKRVFVRADFNGPLKAGALSDATRVDATLPTLAWILEHEGKLVLASHLGRPEGKRQQELSLRPGGDILASRLGGSVTLSPDCVGDDTALLVGAMQPGQVVLLENLRFHPEEEKNDPAFAAQLAAMGAAHAQ